MNAHLLRVTALALALPWMAGCGPQESVSNADLAAKIQTMSEAVDSLRLEVAALRTPPPTARTPTPSGAQGDGQRVTTPILTTGYPALGRRDAPLTIIEFSDYQCPFCARHTRDTLPQIQQTYIDTGQVRYVYMDNPIPSHRHAAKAAEAAHCAGDQGEYWAMHKYLFAHQREISPERFTTFAADVGLDTVVFDQCMASGKHASKVAVSRQQAATAGARATPTFLLGRTRPDGRLTGELLIGAKPYASFAASFNALLAP